MKITFTMSVRDELPEVLNQLARQHGEPEGYEERKPLDLKRQIEWPVAPSRGDSFWIGPLAEPRTVEEVTWDLESGDVRVSLDDLDTDEIGDEESVVDYLLGLGWEVDAEMMGWGARKRFNGRTQEPDG